MFDGCDGGEVLWQGVCSTTGIFVSGTSETDIATAANGLQSNDKTSTNCVSMYFKTLPNFSMPI